MSQTSVKKSQKCKFRWQKVKKSQEKENLGDKKWQTSLKKSQKCKFRWQKVKT